MQELVRSGEVVGVFGEECGLGFGVGGELPECRAGGGEAFGVTVEDTHDQVDQAFGPVVGHAVAEFLETRPRFLGGGRVADQPSGGVEKQLHLGVELAVVEFRLAHAADED